LNGNATKPLNVCIYGGNRLYFASLHIDITGRKGESSIVLLSGVCMKNVLLSAVVVLSLSHFAYAASAPDDAATEKELVAIIQKLMDAVAVGDRAVWQKYVADDVIYTDENWKVLTKKDLIDGMSPLPKGYSGSIKVANVKSRISGDAAVLSWEALEEEFVLGQRLAPVYLVTDTYFRRNGQWQLVAEQIIVRPSERHSINLDPKTYEAFVGEYELAPGNTYNITVENGKLFGQRTGRDRQELLPADVNTFFVKGSIRGEKVFDRDTSGKVVRILDRRENNDLVWAKVK